MGRELLADGRARAGIVNVEGVQTHPGFPSPGEPLAVRTEGQDP
jgi:hypothetical protein